jgi:predicted glycosyltransferase
MSPRFLFYSHDSYGLGHLRRTLALARAVTERDGGASALILTGSALATSYRLPPRVDTVKLPAITKGDDGSYRSARLAVGFEELSRVRGSIAQAAAASFDPTVMVVDKSPLGLRGELEATLAELRAKARCRLVLGLRDVEDSPRNVRRDWSERIRRAIQSYYDTILVYGPIYTLDALDCLGWKRLDVPVHHVGYVGLPAPAQPPPDLPPDYVLVTVGGGGDGLRVAAAFAEAIRSRPLPCPSVIVTGPLMADGDVRRLHRLAAGLHVRILEFRPDMEAVIAGARAVVSMAGYNSVVELMRARRPALLVPRVKPREEQLVRAREMAAMGLAEMIHPDQLTPAAMRAALDRLLSQRPQEDSRPSCDGAAHAADILHGLAAPRPRPRRRARPHSRGPRAAPVLS